MSKKTYDPANVQIICGGVPISGFADGTFLDLAFDEDQFSKTVGADGEVSRAKSNNNTATVTISLMQTSESNDVLSAFANADRLNGGGSFPFLVKEIGSGTTLAFSQSAWIKKFADVTYSKDTEAREWTIDTGQLDVLVGGNSV